MRLRQRMTIIMAMLVMVLGLSACQGQAKDASTTSTSISKGLDAAAQGDMEEALHYFESALDQNPKDAKAKTYLKQAQLYIDADKLMTDGQPIEAEKKLQGTKIKAGAKVLTSQLTKLTKTAGEAASEYRNLDQQLKTLKQDLNQKKTDEASSLSGEISKIEWEKKPWLKQLKSKFDVLNARISRVVVSEMDAANSIYRNMDEVAQAEVIRVNMIQSSGGMYTGKALADVPDSVFLEAARVVSGEGDYIGAVANYVEKKYPQIKTASNESPESIRAGEKFMLANFEKIKYKIAAVMHRDVKTLSLGPVVRQSIQWSAPLNPTGEVLTLMDNGYASVWHYANSMAHNFWNGSWKE